MDFDLGKIPNKKYFSIQEVSEILDIETHTIRYWEKEFANSFSIKRIGNRRMFQQKDIINLVKFKNLLKPWRKGKMLNYLDWEIFQLFIKKVDQEEILEQEKLIPYLKEMSSALKQEES